MCSLPRLEILPDIVKPQKATIAADAGFAGVRRYGSGSKLDTTEVIMPREAGRTSVVSALERT